MSSSARVRRSTPCRCLPPARRIRSEGAGAPTTWAAKVAVRWNGFPRPQGLLDDGIAPRRRRVLTQARVQLQQAMAVRKVGDRSPLCVDENGRWSGETPGGDGPAEAQRGPTFDLRPATAPPTTFAAARCNSPPGSTSTSPAVATLNKMSESLVAYISIEATNKQPEEEATEQTEKPAEQPGAAETGGVGILCQEEGTMQADKNVRPTGE